jgi:NitT/TauT family transport system ATP-binding protein
MSTQAASPANGTKLRMDHVRKTFERDGNSISVLEDISLDVRNGEFICLVGPSGAGKSTMLNVMGGFLSPTSGSVAIDGETVQGPDPRRILVFQERGVFPWLTVEGNIGFIASRTTSNSSVSKASSIPIRPIFPAA